MKRYLLLLLACVALTAYGQKDYNASLFGIKSNGTTMNTRSIQKAIDYIHGNGGGRLMFYVGRYLTGSILLKSNVHIVLNEGAVLVGSVNPYDYDTYAGWMALVHAIDADSISITGQGVIDAQGRELSYNFISQVHRGILTDELRYDRPARPALLYFRGCNHVNMEGCLYKDAANRVLTFEQCKRLTVDNVTIKSAHYWNNDGLGIIDCEEVSVANSYFDASDDAICLKSHLEDKLCENVVIRNCVARSSANGVKFGTGSVGGFRNVKLSNITVYNTLRSAFTIQAVDGGFAENISIDSLQVYNTGNTIYLRVGKRNGDARQSSMKDIRITNVYAELAKDKPDAGYEYEGPTEDLPRNISPCIIAGLKGSDVENVHIEHVHIVSPGGGNPHYAKVGVSAKDLDAIPELPAVYPEFSQWKELPAWGFYIRHATGIVFNNVTLTAQAQDYRPAIVLDDVKNSDLRAVTCVAPGKKKTEVHVYQSSGIKQ